MIVRWLSPLATLDEHDGAGHSSGVHILDRYLARTYAPYARYGDYQVLVCAVDERPALIPPDASTGERPALLPARPSYGARTCAARS